MTPTKNVKPGPAGGRRRRNSRDFPLEDDRRQLALDVPVRLHNAIRRKAKADGVSIRSVVLAFLQDWTAAS